MFSIFPDGLPGLGLLLLRIVLGVTALVQGGNYFLDKNSAVWAWCAGLPAITGGIFLLIGFFTPLMSLLICLGSAVTIAENFSTGNKSFCESDITLVYVITTAVSLLLLGPGAFSLDARLFGRREIIIPAGTKTPKY